MKILIFIMLTGLFVSPLSAQISFTNIDSKLNIVKGNNQTLVTCSTQNMAVNFNLKHKVTRMQQNNVLMVDDQVIQITPLKVDDYRKNTDNSSIAGQKQLLDTYSKYELNYFKNELKFDVITPNNQWVFIKSKGWLIWYFRVGNIPIGVNKPTRINLFASTIIADKILTINAPVSSDNGFKKASFIINEMMETLKFTQQ